MKTTHCIILFLLLSTMAMALPSISGRPNESWFSGSTATNPLYRWLQAADEMIEAGMSLGTGNVYYVDSNLTTAGGGETWDTAVATIDAAIALCTDNNGDVILVAQGHAETNAATGALATCNIAGVTIVGLGSGTNRPTITLSHATAAAFTTTAANVTICNFYIDSTGLDSVASSIIVAEDHTTIENCEFLMADATGQADACIVTSGAANLCDYLTVRNCRFVSPNAGAVDAIKLEEVNEGVVISNCYAYGNFSNAPIHNPASAVCTNLLIRDCILKNDNAADYCIELVSASTGFLVRNLYHSADDARMVDPGSCYSYECYGMDDVDEGAYLRPAVGTP
jgi:hypothetical protein